MVNQTTNTLKKWTHSLQSKGNYPLGLENAFCQVQYLSQALEFRTPLFLIWSLPRLWYGSLSGSISLNHLFIFYNISCYNSLVLLTFVSRSSCRIRESCNTKCCKIWINGSKIYFQTKIHAIIAGGTKWGKRGVRNSSACDIYWLHVW